MHDLIQIVDAALADVTRRSGDWLVCKPGCSQCCVGVFTISALDAERLRDGLAAADVVRASRVRERLTASRARMDPWFPGDLDSGVLSLDDEAVELFEEFTHDEVCPVLDPATGTCDLYAARPVLCRTFGPPVRNEDDGLAICELCFDGASEAEAAACEMDTTWRALEEQAEQAFDRTHPARGRTVIAYAFSG